ncbi:MAG: hypothetical protein M1608_11720 [Candidatus Omnitrophica bacterium]|nr:hypothetical protein [Candidatus Omnitrophota bacterium]
MQDDPQSKSAQGNPGPLGHPSPAEWMDYLYKELPRKDRTAMRGHLRDCASCRAQVEAWRGTMRALNQWPLPRPRPSAGTARVFLKWGIAALLVLGTGFIFGRFSAPAAPDLKTLQAALEPALKPALAADLRQALRADLLAQWQKVFQADRARLAAQLKQIQSAQYEALDAQVQELESQRLMDYVDLRRDLETLALATQTALQRAQGQLVQLAVLTQPENLNPKPSTK